MSEVRDGVGRVQSVLVLGGTSEIGLATVRAMVGGGLHTVVLAARDVERAESEAESIRELGVEAVEVVPFDATALPDAIEVIDEAFRRFGDFDVVILAFGVLGDQETYDSDPMAAVATIEVNYSAAVAAALAVTPWLRRQGHGTLVILSSVAGVRVRKANFVYGSTKAALDGFALGLGDALVGSGASVMVVRPGFVIGRMTQGRAPQPLPTTADAVALAIVAGLARRSEVVWVPGLLRWLFGAFRVLPRPLWRLISGR